MGVKPDGDPVYMILAGQLSGSGACGATGRGGGQARKRWLAEVAAIGKRWLAEMAVGQALAGDRCLR